MSSIAQTNNHRPTANQQPSTTNHPPTTNHQQQHTNSEPQANNNEPATSNPFLALVCVFSEAVTLKAQGQGKGTGSSTNRRPCFVAQSKARPRTHSWETRD